MSLCKNSLSLQLLLFSSLFTATRLTLVLKTPIIYHDYLIILIWVKRMSLGRLLSQVIAQDRLNNEIDLKHIIFRLIVPHIGIKK